MSPQDITCQFCKKEFSKKFNLNRHLKTFHKEKPLVDVTSRKSHIFCIMCSSENGAYRNYGEYIKHLEESHNIQLEEKKYNFKNIEEFEVWHCSQNRNVNYSSQSSNSGKTFLTKYYNCNRSDSLGYVSKSTERITKTGGSIKIKGTCPSRIIVTFLAGGPITVRYIQTHVGHEEESRTQRLSKNDKEYLVSHLKAGVSIDRIIKNARSKCQSDEPSRLNLVTKNDLSNLMKRHNIEEMKHANDMIAVKMKVTEWNSDGKNYAFFFKQIGETHPVLKIGDFALAYMNSSMEKKFREFNRIVCIDGTHGLSKYKNWELTTILVKDETKAGFPVAFMISNRKDQIIQEFFLGALREKLGAAPLSTEFLMSDDDIKYHNAWVKTMGNTPRRLLCTWHVVKNWNIQGKRKIKDLGMRKEMIKDMRKILNATNIKDFEKYQEDYFTKLQNKNENDFMNYLQHYYFRNEERIKSWAYCYRTGVGINTNMAIESLNRYIKKEKLKNNCHIRLEKLLNILEEAVEDKMWKRIVSMKRPHRNTYQGRTVALAHKKAKLMNNCLIEEKFGHFRVKSSKSDRYYNITYKEPCTSNKCREMFCEACKVCFHKYMCDCVEYLIKTTTCKHVHVVAMYEEERLRSVLGEDQLMSRLKMDEEIKDFIEEKNAQTNQIEKINSEDKRLLFVEQATHYMNQMFNLDNNAFQVFEKKFGIFINKNNKDLSITEKKRKFEKQTYYPQKKFKNV